MQIRTKVSHSKSFEKQLAKMPGIIQEKVSLWIFSIESKGIEEVMKTKGYHDEPLKGKRTGQRSVRLNRSYRLIYHVIIDRMYIELLEVNKHDY